ncbi:dihydrofolate reductase family protein [Pseudonocardia sichuanensis]
MRKLVFHIQTTLDNRISHADGRLWEPFPWGPPETEYLTSLFRESDTWVLGRRMYEVIVPWWDAVAADGRPPDGSAVTAADLEFAAVQHRLRKVVISRSLPASGDREVLAGDVAGTLSAMKRTVGKDILLSCGPATLARLADTEGLIDEYLLSVSPAVLSDGPRLFDALSADLALELVAARVFEAGCILARYRVTPAPVEVSRPGDG